MARAAAQAGSARPRLSELTVKQSAAARAARHFSTEQPKPTFHIEQFEGRSVEQKRQFVEAITKATCESLGVEPNSVDIVLTDVKRENWATGGRLWSDSAK